jgi:anti-sigma regulatory factor (Ser/Thr protein kinase)
MAGRRVAIDLELPRDPDAATIARRELRRRFAEMLHQRLLDDIYLVVSELVNNAVIHGHGEIRLRLEHDAGDVRGEVIDAGSGFEFELREVGPFATSGRGLLIVDRLTARWGVHEGTTHVWFEMLTDARDRQGAGPLVGEESRPPQLSDRDE